MSLKSILKKANYTAPYCIVGNLEYDCFVTAAVNGDKQFVLENMSRYEESIIPAFISSMDIEICTELLKTGIDINSGIANEDSINTSYEQFSAPKLHYYFHDLRTALWIACKKTIPKKSLGYLKKARIRNSAYSAQMMTPP